MNLLPYLKDHRSACLMFTSKLKKYFIGNEEISTDEIIFIEKENYPTDLLLKRRINSINNESVVYFDIVCLSDVENISAEILGRVYSTTSNIFAYTIIDYTYEYGADQVGPFEITLQTIKYLEKRNTHLFLQLQHDICREVANSELKLTAKSYGIFQYCVSKLPPEEQLFFLASY